MRLAWWREALQKLDHGPAPAEPLLEALAMHVLPRGVTGATLAAIEHGWSALIDADIGNAAILRHGRERGRNLFGAAAAIVGAKDQRLPLAGEVWALTDIGFRHSQARLREAALESARALARDIPAGRWPAAAHSLASLFILARRDADTGRRTQGSPGRLLRILALRITGR